jgi:hypothetical protein
LSPFVSFSSGKPRGEIALSNAIDISPRVKERKEYNNGLRKKDTVNADKKLI